VQLVAAFALTVVLRAGPDAGTSQASAEAELDALLATTTLKAPMAEVVVVLEGPDPALYRLEEATVQLDGTPLAFSTAVDAGLPTSALPSAVDGGFAEALSTSVDGGPFFSASSVSDAGPAWALAALGDAGVLSASVDAGPSVIGRQVSDGDHVVSARLVYRGQPTGPYPWQQGPRWVLPARVMLQASHGLRFTVRLVVEFNALAPAAQRLVLRNEVEPEMLVAVDDAPLPPPPLPRLPPAAIPTSMAASPPPAVAPVTAVAATPAKKKSKKKVARATQTTVAVPAKASKVPAAGETADALEEATARLRSALAAPGDAGVPPAGATPR